MRAGVRVSSIDVARLAGVSRSAVSRTFTEGAYVSEQTRAKVLKAANALGYRPNAIARGLSKRRTGIVGVVASELSNPFYSELLESLALELQARNLASLVLVVETERIDDLIDTLLSYQVDGVILTAATMSSVMATACLKAAKPVVMLDRYSPHENVCSVASDNLKGGRIAAEHLINIGRSRIAIIEGLRDTSSSADRSRGFRDGLRGAGMLPVAEVEGDYSYHGGIKAAHALLSTHAGRLDALFCSNDTMAIAAMHVIREELGLRVPDDIAVVGYDNSEMSAWGQYDLTTVDQDIAAMVQSATAVLLDRIRDPSLDVDHRVLPPRLVVRGSSGPAPG